MGEKITLEKLKHRWYVRGYMLNSEHIEWLLNEVERLQNEIAEIYLGHKDLVQDAAKRCADIAEEADDTNNEQFKMKFIIADAIRKEFNK
jgi:uncharacterized protein (UPF0335 family)